MKLIKWKHIVLRKQICQSRQQPGGLVRVSLNKNNFDITQPCISMCYFHWASRFEYGPVRRKTLNLVIHFRYECKNRWPQSFLLPLRVAASITLLICNEYFSKAFLFQVLCNILGIQKVNKKAFLDFFLLKNYLIVLLWVLNEMSNSSRN